MIMLITEEMPNIVSLFGGLQVQPSLTYMPRNKKKGPLSVSDLFYGRFLISWWNIVQFIVVHHRENNIFECDII